MAKVGKMLLLLLLQLLRVSCGICGQEFATLQLFNANASIGIPISHFSSFAKAKAKECAQSTAQKGERETGRGGEGAKEMCTRR